MSHTEQMREVLEAIELALRMNIPAAEILDENSPIRDGIRAALTAPAAEVPEAMGDEPSLPVAFIHAHELLQNGGGIWFGTADKKVVEQSHDEGETGDEIKALFTADQLRTYAKQYTQWQSTRLRGGVPELGSYVVNQACWKFVESLPHKIPGPIWNDLKPAVYAALTYYHEQALTAAQAERERGE